jgi:phosphinothricin acetyltransferase
MGFELVGVYRGVGYKLGSWHDVGWWQRSLQPEIPTPGPPRAILEIKESAAIQEALQDGLSLVRAKRLAHQDTS